VVVELFEALRCKPEGRRLDSRILPAALMALGSAHPLTEMSTTNISLGGKGGRCIGLTPLPPSCADCHEIWEPQRPGALRACPGLYRDCLTFYFILHTVYFGGCLVRLLTVGSTVQ
jgi:hypothetical protein